MTRLNNETPNVLGQPITTRHRGAFFYCLTCEKEYRQCKCRVYVSADTLKRATHRTTAPQTIPLNAIKAPKDPNVFRCLSCERPMKDTGKQWECVCGFFYKPAVAGTIPARYK